MVTRTLNRASIVRAQPLLSYGKKRTPLTRLPLILCVDDDTIALAVRRVLLSQAGYSVLSASTAPAAVHLFESNPVELVITDHVESEPGQSLITEFKRCKPAVPVLLLTALIESSSALAAADLILSKGLPPEMFLGEVGRLLAPAGSGEPNDADNKQ